MDDLLDEDGYPTEYALDKIAKWCYTDHIGLMQFIKPLWHFADYGYWTQTDTKYEISTAGCPEDMDPTETKPSDYIKKHFGVE